MSATIAFKTGVHFQDMHVGIFHALTAVAHVWKSYGSPRVVVTSARDGEHMEGSLHYEGRAIDVRRWHLDDAEAAVDVLQALLGVDYDVVLEETHVHIEHDPPRVAPGSGE